MKKEAPVKQSTTNQKTSVIGILAGIGAGLTVLNAIAQTSPGDSLDIIFHDVAHGSSVEIHTPNNKTIIYDLGKNKSNQESASPLSTTNPYMVIISHPHKDHIANIVNIKRPKLLANPSGIPHQKILDRAREHDKHIYRNYVKWDRHYQSSPRNHIDPRESSNLGGVDYHSYQTTYEGDNFDRHSLTVMLSYNRRKILLMGDNPKTSLENLLTDKDFKGQTKDTDILLAPHHGRENAYSPDFLEHLNPRLTIISDDSDTEGTSKIDGYTRKSRGLIVSGNERYCLTTRKDGNINVSITENSQVSISTENE